MSKNINTTVQDLRPGPSHMSTTQARRNTADMISLDHQDVFDDPLALYG